MQLVKKGEVKWKQSHILNILCIDYMWFEH